MLPGAGGRRAGSGCFQGGSQTGCRITRMMTHMQLDTSPANSSSARAIRPGTFLIPGPWAS